MISFPVFLLDFESKLYPPKLGLFYKDPVHYSNTFYYKRFTFGEADVKAEAFALSIFSIC